MRRSGGFLFHAPGCAGPEGARRAPRGGSVRRGGAARSGHRDGDSEGDGRHAWREAMHARRRRGGAARRVSEGRAGSPWRFARRKPAAVVTPCRGPMSAWVRRVSLARRCGASKRRETRAGARWVVVRRDGVWPGAALRGVSRGTSVKADFGNRVVGRVEKCRWAFSPSEMRFEGMLE